MTTTDGTGAGVWAQPRRPDLTQYLDACTTRPDRLRELPPADAFRDHDAKLAGLLETAEAAHAAARRAATGYVSSLPGGADFTATLRGVDEDAIVQQLTYRPARAFARAYVAQQRAQEADAAVRVYARDAKELRARLDRAADQIRDQIVGLWTRARDTGNVRALEDGTELCDTWRALARLYTWVVDPDVAYRRPDQERTLPAELQLLHWEAAGAVTGQPEPVVPLEALGFRGAPPAQDVQRRHGRFGR